jgi:outer membrane biosynthesis protein TonB
MFGNLVESSSHKGDYARRGSFFLGTLAVYALIFMAIGVGSIYAYNTHIENQNLELVSLITPVETSQVEPPQRRETPRPAAAGNNNSRMAVVKTTPVMVTMDPRNVPNKASVTSDVTELPKGTMYKLGNPGPNDNIFGGQGNRIPGDGLGGNNDGGSKELEELAKAAPPPPVKKEIVKPPVKTISLGVINGKASNLPRPIYSAIARAGRASGTVTVQVLIDEYGKVVSARALNGHPLLLKDSVQAAYQARFTPTLLSNQPVKVSGIITYNFVMQ